MSLENIQKLIIAAKKKKLTPPQIAFLALATVYGLRAGEIRSVMPEHIDYKKKTIWIDTEKHGEKREMLLPDVIIPYLKVYDFKGKYSAMQLWSLFRAMCRTAEVKLEEHENWHSFRRRVETLVQDTLASDTSLKRHTDLMTRIFMRYKASSMPEKYYTGEEVDEIVIERHPILEFWR